MKRVPEPELMSDMGHAEAYADADFEEPHSRVIELLDTELQGLETVRRILDLGCGPGDVTFRLSRRFPAAVITAVDGSAAMIELANRRREREGKAQRKVDFKTCLIPEVLVPRLPYDLIVCTSALHHLHSPTVLWQAIAEYAHSGSRVFVYDLFRPRSREEARRLVSQYAGNESPFLKEDFYCSLLAAFEPEEVRQQLVEAGMPQLMVKVVSDRHIIIFGVMP